MTSADSPLDDRRGPAAAPTAGYDMETLESLLRTEADETDRAARWPEKQLRACAEAGAMRWFAPVDAGGSGLPQSAVLANLTRLAAACLSTTFCLTQPGGVIARLARCRNDELRAALLPDLLAGRSYATIGISHLTTSRQHVRPVMRAREAGDEFVLDGMIPWSTGAAHAAHIVMGATLDDGRQLLAAMPTDLPGIAMEPPAQMVGLSATCTGAVRCDGVRLERRWLMSPVTTDVMKHMQGAGTGGLQTSALALGTARAAIDFLRDEAVRRGDLEPIVAGLTNDWQATADDLAALADRAEAATIITPDDVRRRANGLALRASQAALAAAKGSGYVVGHPAGRWCREALFFLVWSCPAPVTNATLCELAKIE